MKDKLIKFSKENKLNFDTDGSGLNSALTVLCGYSDFIKASRKDVIKTVESLRDSELSVDALKEINKVHEFAETYNYGKFWSSEEAKKTYKF